MKKQKTIYAGDNMDIILIDIIEQIQQCFCCSQDEFEDEYPGDKPSKYKVVVNITKVSGSEESS